jgi:RNA polymerase sigma-70 factor (ECF subfamily)
MHNTNPTHPAGLSGLTDAAIAALAAAGDTQAFEQIMRRHNRLLFRTVRSILKSDAETEDAVQEAWLSAWRALAGFRADARLSTWLARIALNEALGRVRRQPGKVIAFDMAADLTQETMEETLPANPDEQPDHLATRSEMRRLMEARIDGLPEVFRTVFMLRAVEEMSAEEVAAALGIPDATVRTRFFRARALLRESLSRDMDFALEDAFSFAGLRCDCIVAHVLGCIAPLSSGQPDF